jgi:hypothetical protein
MMTDTSVIQKTLLMTMNDHKHRKQMATQSSAREEMTSLLARGVESAKPRRIRGRNLNHHLGRRLKLKAPLHSHKMESENRVGQIISPSNCNHHRTSGKHEALYRRHTQPKPKLGL